MIVIKRDGREVEFDKRKISNAVLKAIIEVDGESTLDTERIAYGIADRIEEKSKDTALTVEQIQDMVEVQLMLSYRKDIAKAYILYRNERTKIRDRNSRLVKNIMIRADSKVNYRSNANVDELSFSGREKEASAEIGKSIALDFDGLSHDVAEAHKQMLVYQHDLEKAIYGIHNCLNLNFQEIFTYGFRTRNGDVRPPTSFSTACQLVAVAFQCQSQVQFGGVGSIHLDYDLAPFVTKSFFKHYADGLKYLHHNTDEEANNFVSNCIDEDIGINDMELIDDDKQDVYNYATDMLEREGKQAAQGLYHNLNTLESRQGSQVPFTSINLGRDTSTEGRLVTKWIMEASIDGIGQHHLTSIFPISIFQYKQGTNANAGDPNYDMKQLALESMSKRIYPNWCNCGWSQAHEDENNPDTYFATMGKCKCSSSKTF
ncbi:anaerobic ribonucleoside-triphosphate reductase [Flintibacter muris]|uniref:anaerobic ribonucleoside-triphosphate reductase n=1 Tax=Flintibacter muris TaxID=2941327 RepID=UPI0020417C03|nr:anaerobic ribonucleoside-triphosphate reductase [Flintibacter muris]